MTENLIEALRWFLIVTPLLAVLFLVFIFLMVLLQGRFPEKRVRRLLQQRSATTRYVAGAALGTITPFCSMTTIPMLAVLLRSGVSFGPTMAFLISSPLLDALVLGVLAFLIGPTLTVIYAALTFLASMGIGAFLAKVGFEAEVKDLNQVRMLRKAMINPQQVHNIPGSESEIRPPVLPTWRRAWRATWGSFIQLVPHLLVGTAIGALIRGFMPVDWILSIAGPGETLAIPLAAAFGLPVYINAEILLPIVAALLERGMGIGAVVALIITGLGMSASEIVILTGFFRPRLIAALVLSFFAVAVGGGVLAALVAV